MKKILSHLTVIVLSIAILTAGGCKPAVDSDHPPKATIYLKASEGMKLLLSDTKDGPGTDAKTYYTKVGPGTRVVWRRADNSGIKSIVRVGTKDNKGVIFPGDAKTILFSKRRRITVPADAPVPNGKDKVIDEEYEIVWKHKKSNKETTTDPYLRIRGTDQLSQGEQ